MLKIYNTITREKEEFKPIKDKKVGFYQCGPTVYWTQHIGNIRAVFVADIIDRTLQYLGYDVNFVRNYTDVGHLTSDEDLGEDKLEKGAKREGLSPKEIADKYISIYEKDIKKINTFSPTHTPKATEHIKEIVDMVKILLGKKFAYQTDLAIYFDVSKAKDYTRLSGQKIEDQIGGAGTGDVQDNQKKNPQDFALWFFKKGTHANALQTWDSPWGIGFPGWHIECSAMSKKYLGNTLDIHMGGIEHIPVHHTNEIAQSESANEVNFVNYWIHNRHLQVNGGKMSKSEGTGYSLSEIEKKGFDPLALRFFFLQAHYRSNQNFTWEALQSAQNGLNNLYKQIAKLKKPLLFKGKVDKNFKIDFISKIEDDFNTPQAVSIIFDVLKSNISDKNKLATILDFDKILGLKLNESNKYIERENEIPIEIKNLTKEREVARENKDWKKSDEIREKIFSLGYQIKDTPDGQKIYKK
jgi:cysteinyl-tRNA synthetase